MPDNKQVARVLPCSSDNLGCCVTGSYFAGDINAVFAGDAVRPRADRIFGDFRHCNRGRFQVVFTLQVPAATSPEQRPVATAEPRAPELSGARGKGRRVLVVDDEPAIVELVTSVLQDQGWRVDVAAGGRAALERLQETPYDLVLSDVRMPEGDGADFYRAAVAQQKELSRRFVFMTGDTANEDMWRALEPIRAPVLSKPFTRQALLHAVERVTA